MTLLELADCVHKMGIAIPSGLSPEDERKIDRLIIGYDYDYDELLMDLAHLSRVPAPL